MQGRRHNYQTRVTWTGNSGEGTRNYRSYNRTHDLAIAGKPVLPMSSDPAFRGNVERHNPEDLLVASLSSCHMLWYLHLASEAGIIVTAYEDRANGTMVEDDDFGGRFERVVLRPRVTIAAGGDAALAQALHAKAHHKCYVANSVNFAVEVEGSVEEGG
jgi:organic hydroperoxide reductase OsmC/OhrA